MGRLSLHAVFPFVGLLFFPACGPDLYISRIVPLAPDCSVLSPSRPEDDLTAGMLDVAPGRPEFFAGVELVRHERTVLADGTYAPAGPGDRASGRILINALTLSYETTPTMAGLRERKIPLAVEMDSGWGVATIPVDLIGSGIGEVLQGINPGDIIGLRVSVAAEGVAGGAITTKPLVFPITVYRSNSLQCYQPGSYVKHTGACRYAGQSVAPEKATLECCPSSSCP